MSGLDDALIKPFHGGSPITARAARCIDITRYRREHRDEHGQLLGIQFESDRRAFDGEGEPDDIVDMGDPRTRMIDRDALDAEQAGGIPAGDFGQEGKRGAGGGSIIEDEAVHWIVSRFVIPNVQRDRSADMVLYERAAFIEFRKHGPFLPPSGSVEVRA